MSKELYTIGHSSHSFPHFLDLLKKHQISAVCDVRFTPCSRLHPHFNRKRLRQELKRQDIAYVFLGKELGGRSSDSACFDAEGRVQYKRIAERNDFRKGLERVSDGAKIHRIALMCVEKDPLTCHRTILVCRHLLEERDLFKGRDLSIRHILEDGQIESHEASERRLLRLAGMEQRHLFKSEEKQLEEAYDYQGRRIAYRDQSSKGSSEGHEELEYWGLK